MYSNNTEIDKEENTEINNVDEVKLQKANMHLKRAWIISVISAIITFIFSWLGTHNEMIRYKFGQDTWTLIDVAIIAGLSYGIYKKNRFCALGMLLYFIAPMFVMFAYVDHFSGALLTLIFGYFLLRGTVAAFWLYKYRTEIGAVAKQNKIKGLTLFLKLIGVLLLILLFILLIIGAMSPDTKVVPGKFIRKDYYEFIKQEKLISPNEKIKFLYSDAFIDFRKSLYFITDKNVVLHNEDWAEPSIIIPYSDIVAIEFEHNQSIYEDSIIYITLKDDFIVYFPVSSESNGDKLVLKAIKSNSGITE